MTTLTGIAVSLLVMVTMAACLTTASPNTTTTLLTLLGGSGNCDRGGSCKTLEQRLCANYHPTNFGAQTSLFPFFVHPELLFDRSNPDAINSTGAIETQQNNCQQIVNDLNQQENGSVCLWNYSCEYDPNMFPALDISSGECILNPTIGLSTRIRNNFTCKKIQHRVTKLRRNTETDCWENTNPRTVFTGCELVKKGLDDE